jgi:hypothetical protein
MAEVKVKLLKGNELSYARTSLYYTSSQGFQEYQGSF